MHSEAAASVATNAPDEAVASEESKGKSTFTVRDQIRLIEANTPAKEIASKSIGRGAVPWIVFLVVVGVVSSYYLPSASLIAVIGLVATATMALISMLTGITGTKDSKVSPEFQIIQSLIDKLDRRNPLTIDIEGDKVVISHGQKVVAKLPPETITSKTS